MKTLGNGGAHVGARSGRPLPTDRTYRRHRPWCVDCKWTLDGDQLNREGRCDRCARAAITRAAAAERRAAAEAEQKRAAKARPQELPQEGKQGQLTTRSSAPRANSTSRSTRRARVTGSSTTEKENPPATRETRPRVAGGPTGPRSTTDTGRIRRLYVDEQRTVPEISRLTGHTPGTIRRVLDTMRVPRRDDRKTHSGGHPFVRAPQIVADIVTRYTTGQQTIAQIGDDLKVGRRQITRILGEAGIPIRPAAHLAHPEPDQAERHAMVTCYLAGATLAAIAREHHVRSTYVAAQIRAAGHDIRPKGAGTTKAAQMAVLGITAADVRSWAEDHQLLSPGRAGQLPQTVIDAYAAQAKEDACAP